MIHRSSRGAIDLTSLLSGENWSTIEEGLRRAQLFVSERTGIISRIYDKVHDLDDSYTYSIGSEAADGKHLIGASNNKYNGGGAPSEAGTYLAAVGEGVERYSAAWIPWEELKWATYGEIARSERPGVRPCDWAPFHDRQFDSPGFSYQKLDDDTAMYWSRMQDLATQETVWVPSQLLYLSPTEPHGGGSEVGYATSSGLAYHLSPAEAILGGLYELIERDAFMIAWYSSLSAPLVDVSASPKLQYFLDRYVNPSGVDVRLVDLSEFSGVPTVLGVSINPYSDLATIALGAASGPNLEVAACDAAVESLQTRNWMKAEQRDGEAIDPQESDFESDVRSFEDHIRLYAGPHARDMTHFLTASDERTDPSHHRNFSGANPNDELRSIVNHLHQQGIRVYAADLTSPDVLDARGAVFKVFSPDLQMLDVGYHRRFLGSPRLRSAAYERGYRQSALSFDEINPLPHPFP